MLHEFTPARFRRQELDRMTSTIAAESRPGKVTKAPGPTSEHGHSTKTWLVLLVICGAQMMVVLDATIVNIALPSIESALKFSSTSLTWVLNAYTLAFGGLLLLGGRLGDQFGHRRVFTIGLLVFSLSSLLGGLAQNSAELLVARAFQGVGGALAAPAALALITNTFEEGPARFKAFGVFSAVAGSGAAIGLLLGGILTDLLSWRWVLFVNVPIGLVLAFLAPRVLGEAPKRKARLDFGGAITVTAGMTLLVYGLVRAADHGWTEPWTLTAFGVAVLLLIAFGFIERRHAQPLVPLRMFTNRNRAGAYTVMLCAAAALFSVFFFLTQYIQMLLHYSPLKAGFAFLPIAVSIIVTAQITARVMSRTGPLPPILLGCAVLAGGLLDISTIGVHTGFLHMLPGMIMVGAGLGLNFVPLTITAVSRIAAQEAGVGSALLSTCQQIGGSLGLAILVTVSTGSIKHALVARGIPAAAANQRPKGPLPEFAEQILVHGWTRAFLVAVIFAAVAFLTAASTIRIKRSETGGVGASAAS
jgi:EmrB/QacA subfamily drug resistance transporter